MTKFEAGTTVFSMFAKYGLTDKEAEALRMAIISILYYDADDPEKVKLIKDSVKIKVDIEKVKEEMCDIYCRYPNGECHSEEEIIEICNRCPLNRLNEGMVKL